MRDQRFVAVHRGGPLALDRHRLLALWAADCAEHVLPLFSEQAPQDERPAQAIAAARAWGRGEITVGAARTAAVAAHAAAREVGDDAACFAARAAGHAAATAHMADHAPGALLYAIKARRRATDPQEADAAGEDELRQGLEHLPEEIRELASSAVEEKKRLFH